jgi:hypothetical protein
MKKYYSQLSTYFKRHMAFGKADESLVCSDRTILRSETSATSEYSIGEYVRVLISLWLFLYAAQQKEFFLDVLNKLEQRSHKCVELRGNM